MLKWQKINITSRKKKALNLTITAMYLNKIYR